VLSSPVLVQITDIKSVLKTVSNTVTRTAKSASHLHMTSVSSREIPDGSGTVEVPVQHVIR